MEVTSLGIFELAQKIKAGELKAAEVTRAFLERSKTVNPKLNAFITFNEGAVASAEAIDKAIAAKKSVGILAGVPIGVKDLLCTRGLKTTAASKILFNYVPTYSATVVEKLEKAGAIILGKTNLDEFAMGSSNENSAYGAVKNPWSLDRVPGGSSGGSAASVAAQMVPGSIGTDTGGSIRQPASYCGVVGMKPTYGRVSRYGIIAFASSLDQAGPMAGNIRDTALMLEAISGHDPRDSTSSKKEVPKFSEALTDDLKGLTVGKPIEYFGDGIDPEISATVEKAFQVVKARGAKVVEVSIPSVKFGISIYYLIATSEASSNLARYDGIRFGYRAKDARDIEDVYARSRGQGFGTEVKRRIMLGTYALSSGYYDAYYIKACKARRLLQNDFLKAFKKCDVLLSPVTPLNPFKIGEQINDPLAMYLSDIHTTSTNLAGLPGISVPGGFTKSGLPIGVQLTGRHFDEQTILNVGYAIEKNIGLEKRKLNV
jgi:aspartyl-tRNA(Asn)/glutamyl-tRNA(Gln) amidotransferase subunit A